MNYLKNLILFFISTLIGLFILELLIRLFFIPPQIVEIQTDKSTISNTENSKKSSNLSVDSFIDSSGIIVETKTGRRYKPNVKLILKNHAVSGNKVVFETNSLGYRNPEILEKKSARYLFLGDSITVGDYIDEKDTYVRQVESIFKEKGEIIETINAGVGSISLQTELAILIETGLLTKPDAVVIGFYLNDFAPSAGLRIIQIPKFLSNSYLAQYVYKAISVIKAIYGYDDNFAKKSSTDINYLNWFQELKEKYPVSDGDSRIHLKAFNRLLIENQRDWGMAWSEKAWSSHEYLFNEFYRLSKIHNFKLYFVIFPVKHQVIAEFLENYPQEKLKEVLSKQKIPSLDLLPILRKDWFENKIDIFYDQCHHTPRGKKIIAEEIVKFLQSTK